MLAVGLPLVGSNLAQFVIHITDALMLGWYDVTALAAVTLAGNFFFLTFIVGSGFAFAVTPVVAEAVEAGDEVTTRRVTRMGLWLSVLYGIIMAVPLFFAESWLLAIGQEAVVAGKGRSSDSTRTTTCASKEGNARKQDGELDKTGKQQGHGHRC